MVRGFYQCKKQKMQLKMIKTMGKLSSHDQNFQGRGVLKLVTQRLIVGTQYPGSFHLSPQPSLAFRVLSLFIPRRPWDQQASHLDKSRKRDHFPCASFKEPQKCPWNLTFPEDSLSAHVPELCHVCY